MNPEKINPILESITYLVNILGVPVAIFLFFREKKKERLDREYGTYNTLDDKYVEFLTICLEHPNLNIYENPDKTKTKLKKEEEIQRNIIFEILVCLFERAYLMYAGHSNRIKTKQWIGWEDYMKYWMANTNFRNAWSGFLNTQFDTDFTNYMNILYAMKSSAKQETNQELI